MAGRLSGIVIGWLAATAVLAPLAAGAANSGSGNDKGAPTYKWTDEQGEVHYGDRIPPQYAQKESSVLNRQGVEVRRLDAQKTADQLDKEEHARAEVLRLKQHDAFLLNTYTSEKDIEALRDLRLDQLHGQKIAAEQYVDSLHSRLAALQTRARLFVPYSSRADAHRMPDDLAEDLVHTLNELHTQSNVLEGKTEEETNLKVQFQADIERYKELHAATH